MKMQPDWPRSLLEIMQDKAFSILFSQERKLEGPLHPLAKFIHVKILGFLRVTNKHRAIKWSLEILKCSQNLVFDRFARKRILVKIFKIFRNLGVANGKSET